MLRYRARKMSREHWTRQTHDKRTFRDVYQLKLDDEIKPGGPSVRKKEERERERKRGWRRKKLPVNIPRLPESTKARLIQSGIVPTLRESAWNTPSYRAAPPIAFPLPFIRPLVIIHWNRTADAETQFKSATLSSLGFGTKEEWIRL